MWKDFPAAADVLINADWQLPAKGVTIMKLYSEKKSNRKMYDNSGSAIVEVTLIMPILVIMIVSVLFLLLDAANDAVIQGESFCGIYELSVGDNEETIKESVNESMNERIIGIGNVPKLSLSIISGEISLNVCAFDIKGGKIYSYQGDSVCYKREYDKCTQRLRRWQLYGDVLQE